MRRIVVICTQLLGWGILGPHMRRAHKDSIINSCGCSRLPKEKASVQGPEFCATLLLTSVLLLLWHVKMASEKNVCGAAAARRIPKQRCQTVSRLLKSPAHITLLPCTADPTLPLMTSSDEQQRLLSSHQLSEPMSCQSTLAVPILEVIKCLKEYTVTYCQ